MTAALSPEAQVTFGACDYSATTGCIRTLADPVRAYCRGCACAGCQVSWVLGFWKEGVDEVAGHSGLD